MGLPLRSATTSASGAMSIRRCSFDAAGNPPIEARSGRPAHALSRYGFGEIGMQVARPSARTWCWQRTDGCCDRTGARSRLEQAQLERLPTTRSAIALYRKYGLLKRSAASSRTAARTANSGTRSTWGSCFGSPETGRSPGQCSFRNDSLSPRALGRGGGHALRLLLRGVVPPLAPRLGWRSATSGLPDALQPRGVSATPRGCVFAYCVSG